MTKGELAIETQPVINKTATNTLIRAMYVLRSCQNSPCKIGYQELKRVASENAAEIESMVVFVASP
jgi:hypothetical protein